MLGKLPARYTPDIVNILELKSNILNLKINKDHFKRLLLEEQAYLLDNYQLDYSNNAKSFKSLFTFFPQLKIGDSRSEGNFRKEAVKLRVKKLLGAPLERNVFRELLDLEVNLRSRG